MQQQLATIAQAAGGVFLRADARITGHTDEELRVLVRRGEVRRLQRGVFAVGPQPTFAADRLLERARGVARLHGDDLALSHHAALLLHGVAVHEVPLGQVWALRLRGGAQSGPGLRVVRPRSVPALAEVGGVLTVAPAHGVLQVAAAFGVMAGVVSADSAVDQGVVTAADLAAALRGFGRSPGVARARIAVGRCTPGAQSPGETLLRLTAQDLGLEVEVQFPVAEPGRAPFAFADLRISGTRSLWEFDGLSKYAGASGATALAAEKAREDRIRRLGWGLDRVVWSDYQHPDRLAERLLRAAELHRMA